jgi:hypothetical protein
MMSRVSPRVPVRTRNPSWRQLLRLQWVAALQPVTVFRLTTLLLLMMLMQLMLLMMMRMSILTLLSLLSCTFSLILVMLFLHLMIASQSHLLEPTVQFRLTLRLQMFKNLRAVQQNAAVWLQLLCHLWRRFHFELEALSTLLQVFVPLQRFHRVGVVWL